MNTVSTLPARRQYELMLALAAVTLGLLIVFLPIGTLFGVTVGLVGIVLGFTSPPWALGAIALSIPLQRTGSNVLAIGSTTATRLVVLAVIVGWVARLLVRRERVRIDAVAVLLFVYAAWALVTVVVARDAPNVVQQAYRWGITGPVYLIALNEVRTPRQRRPVIGAFAVGALAMAILGGWQVWTNTGPASFANRGSMRAWGTFGQPNPLAGYFEMTVPVLLALGFLGWERGWIRSPARVDGRAAIAFAGVAGTVGLYLTGSRGGYLGFAAGCAVMALLAGGWLRRATLTAGVMVLALMLLTPLGWQVAGEVGSIWPLHRQVQVTTSNFAVEERLAHWGAGIQMAESSPWVGVGAGNFTPRFRELTPNWRFRISRGHAHNAYLQALAEGGVVGLGLYLLMLAAAIRLVMLGWSSRPGPHTRALLVGIAGVTAAVMVHDMFEYLHGLSLGLQLVLVWALAAALPHGSGDAAHD